MIARMWHGWTTSENADAYERLLRTDVFPGIAAKRIAGYGKIQLLRRQLSDNEVEFVTIMWFDSIESVKAFTGEDYETAYVPERARRILSRFDATSQHYTLEHQAEY